MEPISLPERRPRTWRALVSAVTLLGLALVVYWPVRHFGSITLDDQTYVWGNGRVLAGFAPGWAHYAFTASFGGWAPVVWISFLIDRRLFGASPGAMHLENVCWHAAGAIMLWLVLTKLTAAPVRSWIVAALFVVHPMHVESVAWVSERKDVLSTPPLLAAMLAYWWYCRATSRLDRLFAYGLMLLLYVVSLMTKAMGVTLPALLLLLDYWPLNRMPAVRSRGFVRLLIEKIPVVVIALVFSIVSVRMQQASGASDAAQGLELTDRIGNAVACYVIYLAKLAVPTGLVAFYPHPGSRPMSSVVAAGGLLLLISWIGIRNRTTRPYLLMGWLWFLIALLPVIGLIQVGGQAMADRYSYLPSIGLFVAAVWGAGDLLGWLTRTRSVKIFRSVAAIITAVVLLILSIVARQTVSYWKDTETLFNHCLEVTGPNSVAYYIIGDCALARGDHKAAEENLTNAVEIDPGNDKALVLLGQACAASDPDKSIAAYRQAVDLKPTLVSYRIALAVALTRTNTVPALDEATDQLRQVIRLDPANQQARAGLVDLQARKKRLMDRPQPGG